MKLPNITYKILVFLKLIKKPQIRKFPWQVDIGLTNHCNFNCSMCLNDKITKKRGFMSETLFKSIVDCIHNKFKLKTILGIGLFGEPTLHPKFVDFIQYASQRDVNMRIAINCSLLSKEISQTIIDSTIISLELSFFSLDKEKYNQMVGKDIYEKALTNIHQFLELANQAHFKGRVRLRPFENNSQEMTAYQKEFYEKYTNLNFERQEPKKYDNWAGFFDSPKFLKGVYVRKPCEYIFSRISIDWDGEARLCCQAMMADDLIAGYINKNFDLDNLWHSQKLNEIKDKFLKLDYNSFPSCKNCHLSKRYVYFSELSKIFKQN